MSTECAAHLLLLANVPRISGGGRAVLHPDPYQQEFYAFVQGRHTSDTVYVSGRDGLEIATQLLSSITQGLLETWLVCRTHVSLQLRPVNAPARRKFWIADDYISTKQCVVVFHFCTVCTYCVHGKASLLIIPVLTPRA